MTFCPETVKHMQADDTLQIGRVWDPVHMIWEVFEEASLALIISIKCWKLEVTSSYI